MKYRFILILLIAILTIIFSMCFDGKPFPVADSIIVSTSSNSTNATTNIVPSSSSIIPSTSSSVFVEPPYYDDAPPADIGNFKAEGFDSEITLTWDIPLNEDYKGVRICRQKDNCQNITLANCEIVFVGLDKKITTFTDYYVENDQTYCYKAFTFDVDENYSEGVIISATPKDTKSPTATVEPVDDSTMLDSDSIVISFSETMEPTSLSFSGSMTTSFNWGTWSKDEYLNDTLTISPDSNWVTGDVDLTINCSDLSGNSITIDLTYYIIGARIYVSSTLGSSSNPGTKEEPKSEIQDGISLAEASAPADVWVMEGSYSDTIIMKPGVSLYGGYKSGDWNVRNPSSYITSINATGSNAVVFDDTSITEITKIDGFRINGVGSSATDSKGIYIHNCSPTINNCLINGGSGTNSAIGVYVYINGSSSSSVIQNSTISSGSSTNSYGIYMRLSNAGGNNNCIIKNNAISGGTGTNSYGIRNFSHSDCCSISSYSQPKIWNNTIDGGNPNDNSYGIHNDANYYANANPTIWNNNIDGGSGISNSYGILNSEGSGSTGLGDIRNNHIFTSGTGDAYCLFENNNGADFSIVRNNNLFSCSTALYRDESGTNINDLNTSISTIEGSNNLSAWSNLNENLSSNMSSDLRYTGSLTAVTFDTIGFNFSTYFINDKDGKTRTIEWSIGAYEY